MPRREETTWNWRDQGRHGEEDIWKRTWRKQISWLWGGLRKPHSRQRDEWALKPGGGSVSSESEKQWSRVWKGKSSHRGPDHRGPSRSLQGFVLVLKEYEKRRVGFSLHFSGLILSFVFQIHWREWESNQGDETR